MHVLNEAHYTRMTEQERLRERFMVAARLGLLAHPSTSAESLLGHNGPVAVGIETQRLNKITKNIGSGAVAKWIDAKPEIQNSAVGQLQALCANPGIPREYFSKMKLQDWREQDSNVRRLVNAVEHLVNNPPRVDC